MELKEPEWVVGTKEEYRIMKAFRGNFATTSPNGTTVRLWCYGELVQVSDQATAFKPLTVAAEDRGVIRKLRHPVSDFAFKAMNDERVRVEKEERLNRQKQLEVLRLFEVQHDAGRQLPTTSSSGQLP